MGILDLKKMITKNKVIKENEIKKNVPSSKKIIDAKINTNYQNKTMRKRKIMVKNIVKNFILKTA